MSGATTPVIDGKVSSGEWKTAENHIIKLNTGRLLNFSIYYSSTDVYFLAIVDQSFENDKIIMDVSVPHDYFGIEFDNNKDESIMGTPYSPDDTIIVNYDTLGASDMFMRGQRSNSAVLDTDNGGINNAIGAAQADNGYIYYEIKRPLESTDLNGHDISLHYGDTYQIMLGVWDDQPPHSAAAAFNIYADNSQFLSFTVGGNQYSLGIELFTLASIIIAVAGAYWLSKHQYFHKREMPH